MTRPPEDWIAVLDALLKNDRVALAKVTSVITGFLARYRAYDYRDSWDDIIDEVLIRLIKSHRRGVMREPAAFISYTGTITRNVSKDWFKGWKREADLPGRLDPPEGGPSNVDVLVDLGHALQNLGEDLRVVVEAIYLQGHNYEVAAELLGIPEGTLRRRRTQGLKLLREKMGKKRGSS